MLCNFTKQKSIIQKLYKSQFIHFTLHSPSLPCMSLAVHACCLCVAQFACLRQSVCLSVFVYRLSGFLPRLLELFLSLSLFAGDTPKAAFHLNLLGRLVGWLLYEGRREVQGRAGGAVEGWRHAGEDWRTARHAFRP